MRRTDITAHSSHRSSRDGFRHIPSCAPDTHSYPRYPLPQVVDEDDAEVLRIVRSCSFDSQIDSDSGDSAAPPPNDCSSVTHFGPRCTRCGNPCGDDVIFHGAMAFHRAHFTCHKCGSLIRIPTLIDGEIYCRCCGRSVRPRARACCVCGAAKNRDSVFAGGRCFCRQHFVCALCGAALTEGEFVATESGVYCHAHSAAAPARPKCFKCGAEITGKRIVAAANRQFHPECFCCALCDRALSEHQYMDIGEQQVCTRCFAALPKSVQNETLILC